MTCRRIDTGLDAHLDGALPPETARELERHAADCRDCGRRLLRARALGRALTELPMEEPDPDFFDEAIRAAARGSRATQRQRSASTWIAGAIAAAIAAFAVSALLLVRDDSVPAADAIAQVALAVEETRTINLVFASDTALESVSLTVELPDGVELAGSPGRDRVAWSTRLRAGNNVLPLALVAHGGPGGELVATMRREGSEKVFRVNIAVETG